MTAQIYPNAYALYQEKCIAFDKLAAASVSLCEQHEALLKDYKELAGDYKDLSKGYDVITGALHEADVQVDMLREITGNDALTFFEQEEKINSQQKQIQDLAQYAQACNEEAVAHEETLQDIVDHLVNELNFTPAKYDY